MPRVRPARGFWSDLAWRMRLIIAQVVTDDDCPMTYLLLLEYVIAVGMVQVGSPGAIWMEVEGAVSKDT